METKLLDERAQFVRDMTSGQWSMTEALCTVWGVAPDGL